MVAGDLGVERRGQQVPCRTATILPAASAGRRPWRATSTSGPTFSTHGARMNTAWNGRRRGRRRRGRPRRSRPGGRTRCAAPTTSSPPNVSCRRAALDPVGQHDHPGAGAEAPAARRAAARAAARTGRRSAPAWTSWSTRRRASRARRRASSSAGPAYRHGRRRRPARASRRCSRTSPCRASTPIDGRAAHALDPPVPVRVDLDAALVEVRAQAVLLQHPEHVVEQRRRRAPRWRWCRARG